jgi:hypothetical protein
MRTRRRIRTVLAALAAALAAITLTPAAAQAAPPTWSPPTNLVNPLNQVWQHQEQTYNGGNLYGFRTYGWDQVMTNGGYVNYCVRWDSSATVTAGQRDQINDTSVDIYVNNIRENAPQCSEPCGRFFNRNGEYPNCPGGIARHYDQLLWLTDGFGGGAGGDWGQRMGREYFMNNINAANMRTLLHEIGHTWGLDDFYDWDPLPGQGFIMKAGSAQSITEFDAWMFRDWWRHLKSRYGY